MSEFKDISEGFSTITKTVSDVAGKLLTLPYDQRQRYRNVVDETFQVLDSAILLVINRLGKIIEVGSDDKLLKEQLLALNNFVEWEAIQQKVFMCNVLRSVGGEMVALRASVIDKLALSSREELKMLIDETLRGERNFGIYINEHIKNMAKLADEVVPGKNNKTILNTVQRVREDLKEERMRLIDAQITFYNSISPKKIDKDKSGRAERTFLSRLLGRK